MGEILWNVEPRILTTHVKLTKIFSPPIVLSISKFPQPEFLLVLLPTQGDLPQTPAFVLVSRGFHARCSAPICCPIKGAVSRQSGSFCLILQITRPIAKVSKEITSK